MAFENAGMTPLVLLLVLAAAAMHATWNAMVKSSGDLLVAQTLVILTPSLLALPVVFFLPPMNPQAWFFAILSVSIHMAYCGLLIGAYRHGDFGQVYPIARGSAPVLVAVSGWLLLGEGGRPLELLAVGIVSLGIISLAWNRGGLHHADARGVGYALATGVAIAAYSVSDGLGGRVSGSPATYIAWLFVLQGPALLTYTLWRRRGRIVLSFGPQLVRGIAGGAISGAAYAIVIWAMSVAPMAHVVALRETSVVIAAAIGALLFREHFGRLRIVAAAVVACGAILLQLVN